MDAPHVDDPDGPGPVGPGPRRRTRRLPLFLLGLVLTLVVGGLAIDRWGHEDPPVAIVDGRPDPAASPVGQAAAGGPVGGTDYTRALLQGLPQSDLTIGDAPITIVEFIDLQCPFCAEHQLNVVPTAVGALVRTGRARLSLLPLAFLGPDSGTARTVFFKLAEHDLGWQFADLMFRNHGTENTGYVTPEYLRALVAAIPGADPADADPTPNEYSARASRNADAFAQAGGVDGTPSFLIGLTGQPLATYARVGADWPAALEAVAALERAAPGGATPSAPGQATPGPSTAPGVAPTPTAPSAPPVERRTI